MAWSFVRRSTTEPRGERVVRMCWAQDCTCAHRLDVGWQAETSGCGAGRNGGYLTAMGLSRASDLFARWVWIFMASMIGTSPGAPSFRVTIRRPIPRPRGLLSSRRRWRPVKTWRSPVLLIHGDDDRNVAFNEPVTLVASVTEAEG